MKVLVDTPIWSLALRRKKENLSPEEKIIVAEFIELIREARGLITGPIRQEVLSGISSIEQFEKLKRKLKAFDDLPVTTGDYELAAEFYNRCRKKGIQGSHIDFLLCAVSKRNGIPVFTTDKDFNFYSQHIDVALHVPRVH
ncbi:MAG: PIN domain-containing protein [Candidatus Aminicenantes bacterium]|nr:PIN domain-containing protein [Candidatus Aminicenantes bacterium]